MILEEARLKLHQSSEPQPVTPTDLELRIERQKVEAERQRLEKLALIEAERKALQEHKEAEQKEREKVQRLAMER